MRLERIARRRPDGKGSPKMLQAEGPALLRQADMKEQDKFRNEQIVGSVVGRMEGTGRK